MCMVISETLVPSPSSWSESATSEAASRNSASGPVLVGHADQLVHVLHPAERLDRPVGQQLAAVAGALHDGRDQLAGAEQLAAPPDRRRHPGAGPAGTGTSSVTGPGARASPFPSTRSGTAIWPRSSASRSARSSSALPALPPTPASPASATASPKEIPRCPANPASLATEVSPTPRLGTLTIRRQLTSSSGFTSTRR